jgi:succinate dehydrogenase / fumarate reductase cytochrome b subunit
LHRLTGVFLAVGLLALVYWLSALSQGPESYLDATRVMGSLPGKLLLLGWALSFFFHLLNGIRHLFWDAGKGFELSQVYSSGWMVILGAVVLTVVTWFAISGGAS